jgi:hypothetical protein
MFNWIRAWFKPKKAPVDPEVLLMMRIIAHDAAARANDEWVQLELPLPQDCTCDGCLHAAQILMDGTCGVTDCVLCEPRSTIWESGDDE